VFNPEITPYHHKNNKAMLYIVESIYQNSRYQKHFLDLVKNMCKRALLFIKEYNDRILEKEDHIKEIK
jgi:hypothetical protein